MGHTWSRYRVIAGQENMIEREVKLLLNASAVKRVQVHYAVMSEGYMVVIDGQPLETARRETREFKTLDAAARLLFKIGIADFSVKLKTG
ncbi:hypothetical protein SAMN05216316_1231 [Nitrosovibrio sp. Nv6]|nr:hypothetical protein SAMN05216316_1231 [Nitrosovibrio sp. Nv6]